MTFVVDLAKRATVDLMSDDLLTPGDLCNLWLVVYVHKEPCLESIWPCPWWKKLGTLGIVCPECWHCMKDQSWHWLVGGLGTCDWICVTSQKWPHQTLLQSQVYGPVYLQLWPFFVFAVVYIWPHELVMSSLLISWGFSQGGSLLLPIFDLKVDLCLNLCVLFMEWRCHLHQQKLETEK